MLKTVLNPLHAELGAKLVDFAGWEMPVVYSGIIEEHRHTRQHASFFDVSHMGRVEFRGPDAAAFLELLCTRRIGDMAVGVSRYGHVCNDAGGILDDVIVSRYEDHHLMVCNASNREKLLAWFGERKGNRNVELIDRTADTGMIAIQGPEAIATLEQLLPVTLAELKRYHFKTFSMLGQTASFFRSGYTGEDGIEVIAPAAFADLAVRTLLERSAGIGRPIKPAGLGARDTLRLEAAMPLYGHELDEKIDSISAGQGWAVDLTKDFIGQPVLKRVEADGVKRKIAGFVIEGKRVARQGAEILHNGAPVGVITSGAPSPTLEKVIAMGYLDAGLAQPGAAVEIDLRGSRIAATVAPLPFYKRPK